MFMSIVYALFILDDMKSSSKYSKSLGWKSRIIIFQENKLSLSTKKSHHYVLSRFTISKYHMLETRKLGSKKRVGVKHRQQQVAKHQDSSSPSS